MTLAAATLRPQIAAMALQGILSGNPDAGFQDAAYDAVRHADALLAVLFPPEATVIDEGAFLEQMAGAMGDNEAARTELQL